MPSGTTAQSEDQRPTGIFHLLASAWRCLPALVRGVLTGLLAYFVGAQPCFTLLLLNLRFAASVPWSIPLIAIYLGLYWRYLNGLGWPRSTSEARRRELRARSLSFSVWKWSLLSGGLATTAFCVVGFFFERFVPSDPPRLLDLSQASSFMFVATYLVASAIAGIVEEAAFRGYMQSLIERRYGPTLAITVVAFLFTFFHLPAYPSMSLPQFLSLLGISYTYGILVRLTGSILPGIVIHVGGNALAFLVCALYVQWTGSLRIPLYRETGPDLSFLVNAITAVVFAIAALWACQHFAGVLHREEHDRLQPSIT